MKTSNLFRAVLLLGTMLGLWACSSSSSRPSSEMPGGGGANFTMPYTSAQLVLKDLDEMNRLVQRRIRAAKSGQTDALAQYREALKIVYARPNEDFMTDKIIHELRGELEDIDEWESSIQDLAHESIGVLKAPRDVKPSIQLTYVVIMENLLSEFRPRLKEGWVKNLVTEIRDANIQLSREAHKERALSMMKEAQSPSEIAQKFLEDDSRKSKAKPKSN